MSEERILCYSEDIDLAGDLLRLARAAPGATGAKIHAVVLPGAPADAGDRLARAGAEAIHVVAGAANADPHVVAEMLRSLIAAVKPTVLLLASTKRGREVAGRLAGGLDLPAITGVTGLRFAANGIEVDRETLSGNAVSVERIPTRPAIVGVLPGTTGPAVAAASAERHDHALPAAPTPFCERTEVRAKPGGALEIEKSDRVVTIGRGLKKKEDLGIIEALAKAARADVGCTRPLAAEAGWLTDDHWIGLTGHRVHPKLYVAVGVSGAVQHLVGMRSSKIVVAVNSDPNAPIFAQADYGIVGDLYQIVPALTKALGG